MSVEFNHVYILANHCCTSEINRCQEEPCLLYFLSVELIPKDRLHQTLTSQIFF